MPRRAFASSAAALALAAGVAVAAGAQNPRQPNPNPQPRPGQPNGAPQGQGGEQAQGGPGRQQETGPKPYAQVITAQATTDSGVFITHRIGDKLFYEIPRAMFGREFLLLMNQRGTIRGLRYAGEEVGDRVVRWEREGNHVFLRIKLYDMRADSTQPVARAVDMSNISPIIASFDVAAYSPTDSNVVVEVTKLFTTDIAELNIRQSRVRVRRLDPSRSLIDRVKTFPRNIEVSATQTYEVDSLPSSDTRGINSLTMVMNYSMVLLPDVPMMARLCDDRVGYFNLSFEDFNMDRVPRDTRCYISRFRLEPRDPNAAVSDPVQPIVWYVDPNTPAKWVPWVKKGIEMWQPMFRAAGFSNAIVAREVPPGDSIDLDDARYNSVRWLPSTIQNAYGPHISDPRSGEILTSSVRMYHNVSDLVEAWYFTQAGASDPRARALPLPDSLWGTMMMYVVAHEVGHSIGLRHNMIASAYFPTDSLRSRSFTCGMGATSPSIMDYARYNYVAQPGDNACLMQGMGPYDTYVINWGYRRVPGATTPDAERPFLDSLARLQDANPYFRWQGDGDPTDPRNVTEELGDDAVKSSTYGFANIRRIVPMLIPATTLVRTDDYQRLDDMYGQLLNQWSREAGHVAAVVGGVYHFERYPSQPQSIYQAVPRAKQADAVRFLNEEVFRTPAYFLDTAILHRIEPTGSVERLRTRQTAVLASVLADAKLSRLAEQRAFSPDAYTIGELLGDLHRGLFAEAAAPRPVTDVYRRNLQRAFVDQMDRLINTPLQPQLPPGLPPQFAAQFPPRPADARALARAELVALDAQLRTALLRTTDADTRAHFADLRARIDDVLHPREGGAAQAGGAAGRRGGLDGSPEDPDSIWY